MTVSMGKTVCRYRTIFYNEHLSLLNGSFIRFDSE